MSGVDTSDKQEKSQVQVCKSCMNTVVQTFGHLREQIAQLNLAKRKLQMELENTKKEQKRVMRKEIRVLEKKGAALKEPCFVEK